MNELKKKVIPVVIVIELLAGFMFVKEQFLDSGQLHEIERPDAGEMDRISNLKLESSYGREEIQINVKAKERTEEECLELIRKAEEEIEETVFKNNSGADCITDDLAIKDTYVSGKVKAEWEFDNPEVLDILGKLKRENLSEEKLVNISCKLSVGGVEEVYSFPIRVMPVDTKTPEGFGFLLNKELAEENSKTGNSSVKLPEKIGDISLLWKNKRSGDWLLMAGFGILAGIGILLGGKEDERKKEKERHRFLEEDYPEIVSSLSLYVSAGITVKSALIRIGESYKRRVLDEKDIRPGYEGILQLIRQMQDGGGEIDSIRDFGKRIGHKNYRKLSLLLTQNLRKGGTALGESLEKEEHNAFEERKLRAKIAGEEASTKLLLPMMGLLGIVVVVLVFPAFMGMSM